MVLETDVMPFHYAPKSGAATRAKAVLETVVMPFHHAPIRWNAGVAGGDCRGNALIIREKGRTVNRAWGLAAEFWVCNAKEKHPRDFPRVLFGVMLPNAGAITPTRWS